MSIASWSFEQQRRQAMDRLLLANSGLALAGGPVLSSTIRAVKSGGFYPTTPLGAAAYPQAFTVPGMGAAASLLSSLLPAATNRGNAVLGGDANLGMFAPQLSRPPVVSAPLPAPKSMPIIVSTAASGCRPATELVYIEHPDGTMVPAQLVNAPPVVPPQKQQPQCAATAATTTTTTTKRPLVEEKPPTTVTFNDSDAFPQAARFYHSTSTTSNLSSEENSSEDNSQPPKHQAPSENDVLPVRPLSAYNFFFSDERDKVLKELETAAAAGGDGTTDATITALTSSSCDSFSNEDLALKRRKLLQAHQNKDRSKKRLHRKTHGKIGFTSLSKKIGQRWRALPQRMKDFYENVADVDAARYQNEIDAYNRARIPASKRRKIQ